MGKGTGAAANTREVTSFLVWAHKKGKIKKIEKIPKKKEKKKKPKKIEKKEKTKKIYIGKTQRKSEKEKEFVFSSPGQNMRLLSLPYS